MYCSGLYSCPLPANSLKNMHMGVSAYLMTLYNLHDLICTMSKNKHVTVQLAVYIVFVGPESSGGGRVISALIVASNSDQ